MTLIVGFAEPDLHADSSLLAWSSKFVDKTDTLNNAGMGELTLRFDGVTNDPQNQVVPVLIKLLWSDTVWPPLELEMATVRVDWVFPFRRYAVTEKHQRCNQLLVHVR